MPHGVLGHCVCVNTWVNGLVTLVAAQQGATWPTHAAGGGTWHRLAIPLPLLLTNIENPNFNFIILNFNIEHIYHYCWAFITNIEFRYFYYCSNLSLPLKYIKLHHHYEIWTYIVKHIIWLLLLLYVKAVLHLKILKKSKFFFIEFFNSICLFEPKKFGSRIKKILNQPLKELTIFKMMRKLIFLFFAFFIDFW